MGRVGGSPLDSHGSGTLGSNRLTSCEGALFGFSRHLRGQLHRSLAEHVMDSLLLSAVVVICLTVLCGYLELPFNRQSLKYKGHVVIPA